VEDGFKIERRTEPAGSWQWVATAGPDTVTYADRGLNDCTTYRYVVRAYNAAGDSDYSNETTATTWCQPEVLYPSAEGIVWVVGQSYTIHWEGFAGDRVRIELTAGGGVVREITSSTDNDGAFPWLVPAGLLPGADYRIRIRTVGGSDTAESAVPFAIAVPGHLGDFTVGGYLGVGTESPQRVVHIQGVNAVFRMDRDRNSAAFMLVRTDGTFGNFWKTYVVGVDASGPNQGQFVFNDLGAAVGGGGSRRMTIDTKGDVQFTGDVQAAAYYTPSSLRFKTDISGLRDAISTLLALRGVTFTWRASGERAVGLIAEEVAAVVPELVTRDPDGTVTGISYEPLTAVLVEGLKAQQAQLEKLRGLRDELRALLRQLEALAAEPKEE